MHGGFQIHGDIQNLFLQTHLQQPAPQKYKIRKWALYVKGPTKLSR